MSRTSQSIGRVKGAFRTPSGLRRLMNVWPPFLFAGIRVEEIGPEFRHVRVRLRHSLLTSNYVGTHFGGSLFAMTDPFWMLMVMHNLGPDYVVWDASAEITFRRAAKTAVTATFDLDDAVLDELRRAVARGGRTLRWFDVDVVDPQGQIVAQVRKQLYVRLAATPPPSDTPPKAP